MLTEQEMHGIVPYYVLFTSTRHVSLLLLANIWRHVCETSTTLRWGVFRK